MVVLFVHFQDERVVEEIPEPTPREVWSLCGQFYKNTFCFLFIPQIVFLVFIYIIICSESNIYGLYMHSLLVISIY